MILKRSAVSDAEVVRYDEDRQITNLNLLIDRPRFGEKQVVGFVDKMSCLDGDITYKIRTGEVTVSLTSRGFGSVGLRVLTEGHSTFTFDCGRGFGDQLTVITYRPSAAARPGSYGRLISIAFVPDFFRFKTVREMAATRTVIIEDDRLYKKGKEGPIPKQ